MPTALTLPVALTDVRVEAGDVGQYARLLEAEHRLSRLEEQLDRIDLLICDELGFVRLGADQAQLLFILLAYRYTRGSLAISSNLEFSDWPGAFNDDARLVAALLDRLAHRCHLLQFRSESHRFRESLAGTLPGVVIDIEVATDVHAARGSR